MYVITSLLKDFPLSKRYFVQLNIKCLFVFSLPFYSGDETVKYNQKGIHLLVFYIFVSLLCKSGTDLLAVQLMMM